MRRRIKRHQKRRERAERWVKQEQKPGRLAHLIDPVWRRLPSWLRGFLTRRIRIPLMMFFMNFRPDPKMIGHLERHTYAPVHLDIRFRLFPDGGVQYVNRWGGDVNMDGPEHAFIRELVQHEYNSMVQAAKKAGAIREVKP